jgi:hypothetical protein
VKGLFYKSILFIVHYKLWVGSKAERSVPVPDGTAMQNAAAAINAALGAVTEVG